MAAALICLSLGSICYSSMEPQRFMRNDVPDVRNYVPDVMIVKINENTTPEQIESIISDLQKRWDTQIPSVTYKQLFLGNKDRDLLRIYLLQFVQPPQDMEAFAQEVTDRYGSKGTGLLEYATADHFVSIAERSDLADGPVVRSDSRMTQADAKPSDSANEPAMKERAASRESLAIPGQPTPSQPLYPDPIAGVMHSTPGTGSQGFQQGSPSDEKCRQDDELVFTHTLTRSLAVMETEVTRAMWKMVAELNVGLPPDPSDQSGLDADATPVRQVTWPETLLFANLLSQYNSLTPCYFVDPCMTNLLTAEKLHQNVFYCNFAASGYRLPTEGEWEYCCRAGAETPFYIPMTGTDPCDSGNEELSKIAVHAGDHVQQPGEVGGSRIKNSWQLSDMSGNVREWCWDAYASYPKEPRIDYCFETGIARCVRGGGWDSNARECRSACRGSLAPDARKPDVGFRLVRTIGAECVLSISPPVDDPLFCYQWGLSNTGQFGGIKGADIGAIGAWQVETGNPKTIIAVLDTGIDLDHPDLVGNIWTNPDEPKEPNVINDIHGWNFTDDHGSQPQDYKGHGTHVAGIIDAVSNKIGVTGVCRNCSLMPVQVLDGQGRGVVSSVYQGIGYAVDHHAKILNFSFGTYKDDPALEDMIDYAHKKGCVLIAAAGNHNIETPFYPAAYKGKGVIAVSALDRIDRKAKDSNYGDWIAVSAPGVEIMSTVYNDSYASWSGTSMAAAFVSGVAGLIRSHDPNLTNTEVESCLTANADPIIYDRNPTALAKKLGSGRIRAANSFTTSHAPIPPIRTGATKNPSSAAAASRPDKGRQPLRLNAVQGVAATSLSQAIDVSWENQAGATGYYIYYGTRTREYTGSCDAGSANSYRVSLPPPPPQRPQWYYLVVVPYSATKKLMGMSEEVAVLLEK